MLNYYLRQQLNQFRLLEKLQKVRIIKPSYNKAESKGKWSDYEQLRLAAFVFIYQKYFENIDTIEFKICKAIA